jgi:hypothetical protein
MREPKLYPLLSPIGIIWVSQVVLDQLGLKSGERVNEAVAATARAACSLNRRSDDGE